MNEVPLFIPVSGMICLSEGSTGPGLWVRWEDYDTARREIERLTGELTEAQEAIGLATTLAGTVVMDPAHPLEMMRSIVAAVLEERGGMECTFTVACSLLHEVSIAPVEHDAGGYLVVQIPTPVMLEIRACAAAKEQP